MQKMRHYSGIRVGVPFWQWNSPTCTRGITCDVCGSQYGVLGHDYKLISTRPATCILAGTRIYQCSRCSDSYSEPIPALERV